MTAPAAGAPAMPMFFFGTLMDRDVLALVLGHSLDGLRIVPGRLAGMRRVLVASRSYPMLVPHRGGRVAGCLVFGLDGRDRDRLGYYEGWEYGIVTVMVREEGGASWRAEMFACAPGVAAHDRPWRLDLWQSVHKSAFLPRLRQLMAGYGQGGGAAAGRPPLSPGSARGSRLVRGDAGPAWSVAARRRAGPPLRPDSSPSGDDHGAC